MTEQVVDAQKINDWFTQQYGELDKTIDTLTASLKDVKSKLDAVADDPYNPDTLAQRASLNTTVEYTQKALDNAVKAKHDKMKDNDKAVRDLLTSVEREATKSAATYTEEHFSKPIREHVKAILDLAEQSNTYHEDIRRQFVEAASPHKGETYENPRWKMPLPSFSYSGVALRDLEGQLKQAVKGSHFYRAGDF